MAYKNDIVEQKGFLEIPFKYSYGQYYPVFYEGLRQKKILAVTCPQCKAAILPPRPYCGRCFVDVDEEWVELSDEGWVYNFAVVHLPFIGQPTEPPYCYALIRLYGKDGGPDLATDFHHRIDEVDFDKVHIGMKVKAVWAERRLGTIHDILYFKPVG
jgi:uncharacterized OB-fold protein